MISLVLATAVIVHTLAECDGECDTIGMLQQNLPVTSPQAFARYGADVSSQKENDCLLDMWGTDAEKPPQQNVVKDAFDRLTADVSNAIKSTDCQHVTISASLFTKWNLQGRTHTDDEVDTVPVYAGQAGCALYIVSDWQAARIANATAYGMNENAKAWQLIPFPTEEFLQNFNMHLQSNELQRLYNMLKIATPLFLPESVEQITFADVKCSLPDFLQAVEENADPATTIYTLVNTLGYNKALQKEIQRSLKRADSRGEAAVVKEDIAKLGHYLGTQFLAQPVAMPDIMCMTWKRSKALETFVRRWFWYTATFTMRPQLTWNAALRDCGQGLKVSYLPFLRPHIQTTV
eukprot:Skav203376  [mRNA]  locus=scaffold940:415624:418450:- [translate_table: standard]